MTKRQQRFETFYRTNYRRVMAYALRRTGRMEWAYDVVADTFLIAWQRFDQVDEEDSLPWLFGVAYRVISTGRRDSIRDATTHGRYVIAEPADYEFDFEGWLTAKDELSKVMAALKHLSKPDREILMLVAWENLDIKDIAIVLGIAYPAARTRLHRARAALRKASEGLDTSCNSFPTPDI